MPIITEDGSCFSPPSLARANHGNSDQGPWNLTSTRPHFSKSATTLLSIGTDGAPRKLPELITSPALSPSPRRFRKFANQTHGLKGSSRTLAPVPVQSRHR